MTSGSYHLGIDLGTTYVAAGILRHGRPEIVTLGDRAPVIPSVLFFKEDGEILHGDAAIRRGLSDPTRVVREFKRRVGDATPLVVGQTPYSTDVLLAKLLRFANQAVVERQGGRPASIAVTHPANWGTYKIDILQQAVRMADIGAVTTVTEPVAAAIHYAATERLDVGETVAVYDLGGGTFDAAVLARTGSGIGFEVKGDVEGIERLGGIDFDEAVFHHVLRWCESAMSDLDPDDATIIGALARLRQECVAAKEALSTDTDVSIPVALPSLQTEVRLTRAEFEAMIRPLLQQTVEALERAIRNSGTAVEDLAAVLLVGGSSRVPLIAEMVGAELGRPIAVDQHPKHTVALGAAIAAGRAAGAEVPAPVPAPAGIPEPVATDPTPSQHTNRRTAAVESGSGALAGSAAAAVGTTDAPGVSQLVSLRREGDGPQATIDRSAAAAQAAQSARTGSDRADGAPAANVQPLRPMAPEGSANHLRPPSVPGQAGVRTTEPDPGRPGSPTRTAPFDHRQMVTTPAARPGGRSLVALSIVGVVIVTLLGGGVWALTRGGAGDAGQEAVVAADAIDPDAPTTAGGTETTTTSEARGATTSSTTAETTATTVATTRVAETTVADGLSATITRITVDGDRYAVAFRTNFEPVISGDPASHHLHFFFDSVGVGNAGRPGNGPWILYDGPSPFQGYGPGDRPGTATKLCVTAATHDHAVADPANFDCVDLPG